MNVCYVFAFLSIHESADPLVHYDTASNREVVSPSRIEEVAKNVEVLMDFS